MRLLRLVSVGALTLFAGACAQARPAMPEGNAGISAKYVGDRGIENDPNVVFFEDFNKPSLATVYKRWKAVSERGMMSISSDVPSGSADKKSLLITHVGGKTGSGCGMFKPLRKGYPTLYARWYIKFSENCAAIHHMGTNISGYNPLNDWPNPQAGIRPAGDKKFYTEVEPVGKMGQPWSWEYYTYWKDMRADPSGRSYWGKWFVRDKNLSCPRGKWICMELMVKTNDIGKKNGEQAFWVDGRLWRQNGQITSHLGEGFPKGNRQQYGGFKPDPNGKPWEGFEWRTVKDLVCNSVWTYVYITGAPAGHTSKIWFDNIVVATKYIGPIATEQAKKEKQAAPVAAKSTSPLAVHADALAAAEKLARGGQLGAAEAAYKKIAGAIGDRDAGIRSHVQMRIQGLSARKRLLSLIISGIEIQGAKRVYIDLFGRNERARIIKANRDEATFIVGGSRMPLAWSRLSHHRFAGIATKYAASADEILDVAKYLLACGEKKLVRGAIEKALAAGPDEAESTEAHLLSQLTR